MKISELNPHIRYAQMHKASFRMHTEPSICYDCRLFYFDNIAGTINIGNKKYNISHKTAVFLPPETEYELNIVFKEKASFIVLNFDLNNVNEHITSSIGTATKRNFNKELVPPYDLPNELSMPIIRNLTHIKRTLIQCVNCFIIKNTFYRENASALLKLCLLEILKDDTEIAHSQLCKDVLSYIHENYSVTTLTNEDIASNFNYHPYHLSNIIKEETGKTLHQFLIYYRLRLARDLLVTTQYSISEIAWKCGFSSTAYFIKLFRQNVGMTPKDYRKQYETTTP